MYSKQEKWYHLEAVVQEKIFVVLYIKQDSLSGTGMPSTQVQLNFVIRIDKYPL